MQSTTLHADKANTAAAISAADRDRDDPLRHHRERFHLPDGIVYLDGNSLGLLPRTVPERVAKAVSTEWGESLVRGWNDHGWFELPERTAAKIGRLVGAAEGSVMVADSTSVNVFKVLSAALRLRPERRVILSDDANFPTDLYVAQGLVELLGNTHEIRTPAPKDVLAAIDETVAAVMLTEVDYRTGRRYDMRAVTEAAHRAGALCIWDLAHSAGAFPVDLGGAKADFAIGCGYKYLNGGPGAPAFLYVAPEHQGQVRPALAGWMGHGAPFAFHLGFAPAEGIRRFRVGTPPILSLVALDAALDVFADVDLRTLREKSVALCDVFIAEVERRCPDLELITPRDASVRGSQVSFRHPDAYAIVQALIAEGVVGDFRAPDVARFGIAPLYLSFAEIERAAETIGHVMRERLFEDPAYSSRKAVT